VDFSELLGTFCPAGGCSGCGGCSTQIRKYVEQTDAYRNDPAIVSSEYNPAKAPNDVAALLYQTWEAAYWTGGKLATPTVITVAFADAPSDYTGMIAGAMFHMTGAWQQFTDVQKEGFYLASAAHNAASGVELIWVSDPSKADITLRYEEATEDQIGAVMAPGPTALNGDIWWNSRFSAKYDKMDFRPGNEGYQFLQHEFGHAIGLSHPFAGMYKLPEYEWNRAYSVMTHTQDPTGNMSLGLRALDIAAVSYIYGTYAQKMALPVQWSQMAGGGLVSTGNDAGNTIVGIADRDWERGGKGNDTLHGGEGDDFLAPGTGLDIVLGGQGTDTLILGYGRGEASQLDWRDNTLELNDPGGKEGFVLHGGDRVSFTGIEVVRFTDGDLDLRTGAWTPSATAQVLNGLYGLLLDRRADNSGLRSFADLIDLGGGSAHDVAAAILGSPERAALLHGDTSTATFAQKLYAAAYGTALPEAVLAGWSAQLNAGLLDRADLVVRLTEEAEYRALHGEDLPARAEGRLGGTAHAMLSGTAGNDVLRGGAGDDRFHVSAGRDTVLGGTGHDALVLDLAHAEARSWHLTLGDDPEGHGARQGLLQTAAGVTAFKGIEEIRFVDGTLSFDRDGAAAQITRVWLAATGHAPDSATLLTYLDGIADGGSSLLRAAQDAVRTAEFAARFGTLAGATAAEAAARRSETVDRIWDALVGHAPTAAEKQQWVTIMADQGHGATGWLFDTLAATEEGKAKWDAVTDQGIWIPSGTAAEAARIFQVLHGRAGTAAELAPLVQAHEEGGLSWHDVIASLATPADAALTDAQFIGQAFGQAHGRAPDAAALSAWVAQVGAGRIDRADLVHAFAEDVSHAALMSGADGRIAIEATAVAPLAPLAITGVADYARTAFRGSSAVRNEDGSLTVMTKDSIAVVADARAIQFLDGRLVFDANDPAAQVTRLHKAVLGDAPDQASLNAGIEALQKGGTLKALAESLVAKSALAGLDDGAFVDALYAQALGRGADAGGRAFHLRDLAGGQTRGEVATHFSESLEERMVTAPLLGHGIWDVDETAVRIANLYDAAFNRLPDLGGFQAWKGAIDRGAFTVTGFASALLDSAEFQARYGNPDNGAFIDLMYRNALNREADAGGHEAWTHMLDSGAMSRAQVLLNFANGDAHLGVARDQVMSETPDHYGIAFA
jgi:hypothetical protein